MSREFKEMTLDGWVATFGNGRAPIRMHDEYGDYFLIRREPDGDRNWRRVKVTFYEAKGETEGSKTN